MGSRSPATRCAPGSASPTSSPLTCSARSANQRGGERPTARPARRTAKPAATCDKACQHDRCAKDAAERDDDLDAYVKEVVDTLPPLTDEQRDQLALIFRSRHRKK
jgi:hypothetical protein